MRLSCIVLLTALLALTSSAASAQGYITPYIGYNFGGDSANCQSLSNCEEKHANFGVSIGAMGTLVGIEEDIGYAKNFFAQTPGSESNVFSAMTNLLVGAGVGPVQPFLLIGLGVIRPHVDLNPTQSSSKAGLGYDVGGGVNVYPTKHVGIRADARHLHTISDVTIPIVNQTITTDKLKWWRASLGLALRF